MEITKLNIANENLKILQNIEDFKWRMERLSLESSENSSFFTGIKNWIAKKFYGVADMFYNIKDKMMPSFSGEMEQTGLNLKRALSRYGGKLSDIQYRRIEEIVLPVFPGLRVDFKSLVNKLKEVTPTLKENIIADMESLDKMTGLFISDDNFRRQLKPSNVDVTKLNNRSELLYNTLHSLIDPNNYTDNMKLSALFSTTDEIYEVGTTLSNMCNSYSVSFFENSKSLLNDVAARVNALSDYLTENKDLVVSKEALNSIATVTESVAKSVTNTFSLIYLLKEAAVTVEYGIKKISEF